MIKPFKKVSEVISDNLKSVVVLAGITFTLFCHADTIDSAESFSFTPSTPNETEKVITIQDSEVKIELEDNTLSTSELIQEAFMRFKGDCESITPVLDKRINKIASILNPIKISKATVDGNGEEGRLKIICRLPDDMILSIMSVDGLNDDDSVFVNLFRNRRPFLSDRMPLTLLRDFIVNVQARQKV